MRIGRPRIVVRWLITAVLAASCGPAGGEAAFAARLGASYYATVTLDGTTLENGYVPRRCVGFECQGGEWRRTQQTGIDPVVIDSSLREHPGPGYVVRMPAVLRKVPVFADPAANGDRFTFEGEVQLCGTDGLIVVVHYEDLYARPRPTATAALVPDRGRWLLVLTIDRYENGNPSCLGTPLPARP